MSRKISLVVFCGLLLFASGKVQAETGSVQSFFVEPTYDIASRNTIQAKLVKTTNKVNFYFEESWLANNNVSLNQLSSNLGQLGTEFETQILPQLVQAYGWPLKWQDSSWRLTVVFHPLKKDYQGYTRTKDVYSVSLMPDSNNQPIIFLNADVFLKQPSKLNLYLAHEFTHLLSLYLKLVPYKVLDDTWLEELRAELSESLTQTSNFDFQNSLLKKRRDDFAYATGFSLENWQNSDQNYAAVNLLGQYFLEKYGSQPLKDSLKSPYTNAESLNYALKKNGSSQNFSEILRNWMIASVFNDCSQNKLYCYNNPYLKNLEVNGDTYYIPTKFASTLSGNDALMGLTGKWLKIVGGLNTIRIKLTFNSNIPLTEVPYVIFKTNGTKELHFLDFTQYANNEIVINNQNHEVEAVVLILSLASDNGQIYSYNFSVESSGESVSEAQIISALEKRVKELQQQLAALKLQLAYLQTQKSNLQCTGFSQDLTYGMTSPEVKCLQQFLANLGPEIYPEKLVTGYYGPLTQAAVKRYQALRGIVATGYFGPLTRAQVNQEL